jgi:hypothetical protein
VKRVVLSFLALGAFCASSVPASAQERGNVGLVMAMPTDVGVIWHVTDKVAVRPEINFSFGSSETEVLGLTTERTGRAYSFETSVLFYVGTIDVLRTYVAPRVAWEWSSSSNDDIDAESSSDGMEVSMSYGAEYAPVPRFSVFGEIGLEYARWTSGTEPGSPFESRSSAWAPRTQVGVVLYFGGR